MSDLHVELEDLDGRGWRWSSDERSAWDVPASLTFSTRRGEGFVEAGCVLKRPVTRDFCDLGLLNRMRFVSDRGEVAWEGRITAFPRSSSPNDEFFTVSGVGMMAHAADRTFRELYIDRDISRWGEPSAQRIFDLAAAGFAQTGMETQIGRSETTYVTFHLTEQTTTYHETGEAWYHANGIDIGELRYDYDGHGSDANWDTFAFLSSDDVRTTSVAGTDHSGADQTDGAVSGGAGYKYAGVTSRMTNNTFAGSTNVTERWNALRAIGTHGLALRGTQPNQGFSASDIIRNTCDRFCPLLSSAGVGETSYVIEQAAFLEPKTPFDAWGEVNQYHLWDLAVWEDATLHFTEPLPLDDYDWEIRLDDPGTSATLQGDSIAEVANGVVVRYTHLITGREAVLTPETDAELRDDSPENPANRAGIDRWLEVAVPFSTLRDPALQIGRAYLGEALRAKAPGELSAVVVRDRSGNRQPAWKVRAGQRVVIADHPNDAPRRITETSFSEDQKQVQMTTDLYSNRLEAVLARYQQGRTARGV